MFSPNSRYAKAGTYTVRKADGTLVRATRPYRSSQPPVAGSHERLDEQRLDVIAAHYLSDATAFWRLCDANDSIAPDALAAHPEVNIPEKER
jgi:hypothetical protein